MSGVINPAIDPVINRWDGAHAAQLDERQRLVYRSNLLGADLEHKLRGREQSAKIVVGIPLSGD